MVDLSPLLWHPRMVCIPVPLTEVTQCVQPRNNNNRHFTFPIFILCCVEFHSLSRPVTQVKKHKHTMRLKVLFVTSLDDLLRFNVMFAGAIALAVAACRR